MKFLIIGPFERTLFSFMKKKKHYFNDRDYNALC